MNNFTKDELEQMRLGLYHLLYTSVEDKTICALMNKLQSIIDSYCEHEGNWSCTECKKCGEFYR